MFKDMFTLTGRWGRLNRLRYFGYALLSVLLYVTTAILSALVVQQLGFAGMLVVMGVGYLVLLWISICLMAKRLHDLNLSAWWVLGFFGLGFLNGFFSGLDASGTLAIVFLVITLAASLCLLFWPGTAGDNQYGPDPKGQ